MLEDDAHPTIVLSNLFLWILLLLNFYFLFLLLGFLFPALLARGQSKMPVLSSFLFQDGQMDA